MLVFQKISYLMYMIPRFDFRLPKFLDFMAVLSNTTNYSSLPGWNILFTVNWIAGCKRQTSLIALKFMPKVHPASITSFNRNKTKWTSNLFLKSSLVSSVNSISYIRNEKENAFQVQYKTLQTPVLLFFVSFLMGKRHWRVILPGKAKSGTWRCKLWQSTLSK